MSTESQTPTDITGAAASSSSSRRAVAMAAAVFAVVAITGLTWAKWWPYAGKLEHTLASHAFGGTSILTDGTAAPPAPSWHSAWHFTVTYFDSVWIALVAALVIAAATDALLPRRWLVRQLARGPKWLGGSAAGGLASLPSMMCTCCTAPLTVTLRRRGVPPASALAYWVGNPTLNPAVLAFLAIVLPWQWVAVRVVGGLVLVFVITAVSARLGRQQEVEPTWSESDLADKPMALVPTLRRFGTALGRLSLTLLPEYLVIVFLVGAVRGWLFPGGGQLAAWGAVGIVIFAVAGTLFVIPTAGEIPIIQGLLVAGAGAGPAGALLITLPALSLPSLIMVARSFSRRSLAVVTVGVVVLGIASGAALAVVG
jgi:uncharacterized membrane protein YraQ (UPF0718 family)